MNTNNPVQEFTALQFMPINWMKEVAAQQLIMVVAEAKQMKSKTKQKNHPAAEHPHQVKRAVAINESE